MTLRIGHRAKLHRRSVTGCPELVVPAPRLESLPVFVLKWPNDRSAPALVALEA